MKNIGVVLDNVLLKRRLPEVDCIINLAADSASTVPTQEVVDGEQNYALFELTEQADDLAMQWSRKAYAALTPTEWRSLFVFNGIDLQPLVINRLFRGFFLDRARIYLGVQRILESDAVESVIIFSSDGGNGAFAQAACTAANVPSTLHDPRVSTRRRVRVPAAFQTFLHDIARPALSRSLSAPRSRIPNGDAAHIVFFERHQMAVQMAQSAFDALQKIRDVLITIVHFDPEHAEQIYPRARHVNWDDYQDPATLYHLLRYQTRVMALRHETCDWLDPVLGQVAPYTLRFLRQTALPSIAHTLEITHKIVQVECPNLLVTVDETGLLGKAVAVEGRRSGIPTLNIQHGVRSDSPWIEDQLFDHFAVFGPSSTQVFVKRGNDPAMFVATGAARYDRLFRREGLQLRDRVAAELALDADRPIITFASQRAWGRMTPGVKRETLIALLRAWRQTNAQLVIKLRDDRLDYVPAEAFNEPGWERVKVTAGYDLYDLFDASDIVVTAYSTAGMEAVALGKPLIIINLTGQPDPIPYVEDGVAVGVYRAEDVGQALEKLLKYRFSVEDWEKNRRAFIRRHLTSDDGHSAERIAQLMGEMLGQETGEQSRELVDEGSH